MVVFQNKYLISENPGVFESTANSLKVGFEVGGIAGEKEVECVLFKKTGQIFVSVEFDVEKNFFELSDRINAEVRSKVAEAVQEFELARDEQEKFIFPYANKQMIDGAVNFLKPQVEEAGGKLVVGLEGKSVIVKFSPCDKEDDSKGFRQTLKGLEEKSKASDRSPQR